MLFTHSVMVNTLVQHFDDCNESCRAHVRAEAVNKPISVPLGGGVAGSEGTLVVVF